MHIYSKYVHKCQKRPFTKAQRPKKDLDPSKSHPFEVGLSGPSHIWTNRSTDCVVRCTICRSVCLELCEATQSYHKSYTVISEILQGSGQIKMCQSENSKWAPFFNTYKIYFFKTLNLAFKMAFLHGSLNQMVYFLQGIWSCKKPLWEIGAISVDTIPLFLLH